MRKKVKLQNYPLILIGLIVILNYSCKKDGSNENKVIDGDGNVYKTVTIGNQVWMAENLKTTKYRDGSAILNPTADFYSTNGAYCWYNNDIQNKDIYGALYNYYSVVDSRKICPLGWHVPSEDEWFVLFNYLGGDISLGGNTGKKLAESGTSHWTESWGTNESGFTALPGGRRAESFGWLGERAFFWSSTEKVLGHQAWSLGITRYSVDTTTTTEWEGFSVRCIKD